MRRIRQENPNTPQLFDEMWRKDSEVGRKYFFDMYRFQAMADGIPYDGRVVEFGAGCSDFLSYLLNHRMTGPNLWLEAYAIDYSKWAMEYMHRLDPRIQHKTGDFFHNGYQSQFFDAVLAGETIEHMEEPELLVAEMARVTKNGGLFRITTPLPHLQSTSEHHVWEFEPSDLLTMFKNHATGNKSARVDVVGNYLVATGWR